jgi:hypothetical protein
MNPVRIAEVMIQGGMFNEIHCRSLPQGLDLSKRLDAEMYLARGRDLEARCTGEIFFLD